MQRHDQSNLYRIAIASEKIIAVNVYGRSGTALLQSLFDGHPNVITTPSVYLEGYYSFFESNAGCSKTELIAAFCREYPHFFDATKSSTGIELGMASTGPEQNTVLTLDQEKFCCAMEAILDEGAKIVSRKLFFQAIHVAYHYALGRAFPESGAPLIVYPLHAASRKKKVLQFEEDFPAARYILMIREPVDTLQSEYKTAPGNLFFALFGVLLGGVPFGDSERFRAVRLEDLRSDRKATMQRLADWTGIPWDECLISSTYQGQQWWRDKRSERKELATNLKISEQDQNILAVLLCPKRKFWGYDSPAWSCSLTTRLLTLPRLLLPLECELSSLISFRKSHMDNIGSAKSLRSQAELLAWATGVPFFVYLPLMRIILLKAWLQMFRRKRFEIPLI